MSYIFCRFLLEFLLDCLAPSITFEVLIRVNHFDAFYFLITSEFPNKCCRVLETTSSVSSNILKYVFKIFRKKKTPQYAKPNLVSWHPEDQALIILNCLADLGFPLELGYDRSQSLKFAQVSLFLFNTFHLAHAWLDKMLMLSQMLNSPISR